jgi:O-methyltransferase
MRREKTAFFNKQYRDQPDGSALLGLQKGIAAHLFKLGGGAEPPSHVFFADDCMVTYRNVGFLRDQVFQESIGDANLDDVFMARIWRIWVLAWAIDTRWKTEGALVDCGTYNGKALKAALSYAQRRHGKRTGQIIACDLFDSPPDEARKLDHGPHLAERVRNELNDFGNVSVVQGKLPHSLTGYELESITFCQIDLNSAEADLTTFEYLYPLLTSGAIVIFDDYGFSRYSETQKSLDSFLMKHKKRILELPTGQGLYIH